MTTSGQDLVKNLSHQVSWLVGGGTARSWWCVSRTLLAGDRLWKGDGVRAVRLGAGMVGLAALLLTSCGLPEGVDGDLVGKWDEMSQPVGFMPEAGVCHDSFFTATVTLAVYQPVPCDRRHILETVHVGEFDGDAAERHTRPGPGSPEMRAAYLECDDAAADYLGGDFRHGRLWLGVVRPSRHAWDGGARWFRCDIGMWLDYENQSALHRHGSTLQGALAERSGVSLGCFDPESAVDEDGTDLDHLEAMNPVDCGEPHTAEFVGVWTAPDTVDPPDFDQEDDRLRVHRACLDLAADYIGVSNDSDFRFQMGTIVSTMSDQEWAAGNRGVRCFLWREPAWSQSLEGAGRSWLDIVT